MRRALNWIVSLPAALIVIAFAVANRDWTRVSFDPFNRLDPVAYVDMPLWALMFCGLFLGLVCGWAACWVAQGRFRRQARDARAENRRLAAENTDLRQSQAPRPGATSAGGGLAPF